MNRLDGKAVLVTGGASGIGRATCARLASEGAAVAALDVQAVGDDVPHKVALTADVSDHSQVDDAVARAAAELGGLHGVVTCAGIFVPGDGRPAADVKVDDFLRVLNVNLVGTWLVLRAALPHLVESRGALVTIASTAALHGHGVGVGYTASKGGVTALTRIIATQYGRHGVRANCICPGGVDTPMSQGVYKQPDVMERLKRTVPLGRAAEPEELAAAAAFLLSDDASFMTGHTLVVDGGVTIS